MNDHYYQGYYGSGMGGGLFCHDAICVTDGNTYFRNKATIAGGAVYALLGSVTLSHETISQNKVRAAFKMMKICISK